MIALRRLSEIPRHPKMGEACEAAYRRGYQQGAFAAMEAAESGVSLYAIRKWISGALYNWRYYRSHSKKPIPPRCEP